MPNPDRLSEFKKLYYQIADLDITVADLSNTSAEDPAILASGAWTELCNTTISPSSNINNYEIKDTCTGDLVGNTPGRESFTLDVTIYDLRLTDATVRAWNNALNNRQIIALMGLNDVRTDGSAWGFVGNFVRIDASGDQPDEGPMTTTYTFGPAARSAFLPLKRLIYGANIA